MRGLLLFLFTQFQIISGTLNETELSGKLPYNHSTTKNKDRIEKRGDEYTEVVMDAGGIPGMSLAQVLSTSFRRPGRGLTGDHTEPSITDYDEYIYGGVDVDQDRSGARAPYHDTIHQGFNQSYRKTMEESQLNPDYEFDLPFRGDKDQSLSSTSNHPEFTDHAEEKGYKKIYPHHHDDGWLEDFVSGAPGSNSGTTFPVEPSQGFDGWQPIRGSSRKYKIDLSKDILTKTLKISHPDLFGARTDQIDSNMVLDQDQSVELPDNHESSSWVPSASSNHFSDNPLQPGIDSYQNQEVDEDKEDQSIKETDSGKGDEDIDPPSAPPARIRSSQQTPKSQSLFHEDIRANSKLKHAFGSQKEKTSNGHSSCSDRKLFLDQMINFVKLTAFVMPKLTMAQFLDSVNIEEFYSFYLLSLKMSFGDPHTVQAELQSYLDKKSFVCGKGWIMIAGKCLLVANVQLMWEDAEKLCEDEGAVMLHTSSRNEHQKIVDGLLDLGLRSWWFGVKNVRWTGRNSKKGQVLMDTQHHSKIYLKIHTWRDIPQYPGLCLVGSWTSGYYHEYWPCESIATVVCEKNHLMKTKIKTDTKLSKRKRYG